MCMIKMKKNLCPHFKTDEVTSPHQDKSEKKGEMSYNSTRKNNNSTQVLVNNEQAVKSEEYKKEKRYIVCPQVKGLIIILFTHFENALDKK